MTTVNRQKLKDTLIGQLAKLPPTDQMWADIFESLANLVDPNTFQAAQTFNGAVEIKGDLKTGKVPEPSFAFVIENPTGSEDIPFISTNEAITITKMRITVKGTTPSVTFSIIHDPDISQAGNELVTGGTTVTDETTGLVVTAFNDATIEANSHLRFKTTAQSGTVTLLSVTFFYKLT